MSSKSRNAQANSRFHSPEVSSFSEGNREERLPIQTRESLQSDNPRPKTVHLNCGIKVSRKQRLTVPILNILRISSQILQTSGV
jgi:hypothetical protein